MKKFISMVLTAAMIVSLVPTAAFAAANKDVKASAKAVGAAKIEYGQKTVEGAELQMKVSEAAYAVEDTEAEAKFEVTLDNAKFDKAKGVDIKVTGKDLKELPAERGVSVVDKDISSESVSFKVTGKLAKDDVVIVDLDSTMKKAKVGAKAKVSVESSIVDSENLVYATVYEQALKVKPVKTVSVAEEELVTLNKIRLEPAMNTFRAPEGEPGQKITLKLSKGFEFAENAENEMVVYAPAGEDEFEISDLLIEATEAKAGTTAVLTISTLDWTEAKVNVAKVVNSQVVLSVEQDEDAPVMYSGVDTEETGLTAGSTHESMKVTLEESYPGAWSGRAGFTMELPEGVYVTDVETDSENFIPTREYEHKNGDMDWDKAFAEAYQNGDHVTFEFAKRMFADNYNAEGKAAKLTFVLTLVADPDFEGDAVLKVSGSSIEEQQVVIAKFIKPYTVETAENKVVIDYRYTKLPSSIVVKEAEADLWEENTYFNFFLEKGDLLRFENGAKVEADEASEMKLKEIKDGKAEADGKEINGVLGFTVKQESEEAATVTISDMELFLERNIPAGPYDLSIGTKMAAAYNAQPLFAPDADTEKDAEQIVSDVSDYDNTVKEGFVTVITAGRDQDDSTFTTKVVVPVGAMSITAGDQTISLDVPAYISDAGYTMLPVRAVVKALGLNNDNVKWDDPTKTVTIFFGQRVITMVLGQKTVTVNGNEIPASEAVSIVNGRTFLPMRDLANALGVTDITWDAATKTATLNGSAN